MPLHYGKAPQWLTSRMCKLGKEMASVIIEEYGRSEFLHRVSDPFWFQALGCVLGYDWHSSGVTTVLTGVLKNALSAKEHGLVVCGGKGRNSKRAPAEISVASEEFGFTTDKVDSLCYASRMTAKVDNTAIQAGYQLYHHAFLLSEEGNWAVIQQGMCPSDRTARRYHWLSDDLESYVVTPHSAVVGDSKRKFALDMTAKESEGCRETSVDIAKERPERVTRMLPAVRPLFQTSLNAWLPVCSDKYSVERQVDSLFMPVHVDWKTLEHIYEIQPSNYEELLGIRGVGPATVRGLALISELIYGEKPSWSDPVRFSFAYGGKDGVPYPVNREAMDKSIEMLHVAVQEAKIGNKMKMQSVRRLKQFTFPNA
jgi:hypothetical protein